MNLIKSISFDQAKIIQNILDLHCPSGIDLDATYSKGIFYKSIPKPKYKSDITPISKDVIPADAKRLPFKNDSLHCVMFDPPFLATTGKSLTIDNDSNKINKRFSVFPNELELHKFYIDAMIEFYRVLKNSGILIFKCQDKISSGKQYMSHVFIINEAEKLGYYCKDMFILLAKNRIVADWQLKNQKNARKFHSYFLVFEKSNKKIKYI